MKAQEIIQLAKQHGYTIRLKNHNTLGLSGEYPPPSELVQLIKQHKPLILTELVKTEWANKVKRAYNGYFYCLNQVQQSAKYQGIPRSHCRVKVEYWRNTVKQVLNISDIEMTIIQRLLIQESRLMYFDEQQSILTTLEQEQIEFKPDSSSSYDFHNWLNTDPNFIYC